MTSFVDDANKSNENSDHSSSDDANNNQNKLKKNLKGSVIKLR